VIFTTNADPPPGQIAVYDISGRMVRSLVADPADGSFFWDGTDGSGEELSSGTYIVRGASDGRLASISVVKL
ncbi:MAG: FlgD immunoglobulin-like domain containing protein, partial [Candidatus Fermentibacterota bacterium]